MRLTFPGEQRTQSWSSGNGLLTVMPACTHRGGVRPVRNTRAPSRGQGDRWRTCVGTCGDSGHPFQDCWLPSRPPGPAPALGQAWPWVFPLVECWGGHKPRLPAEGSTGLSLFSSWVWGANLHSPKLLWEECAEEAILFLQPGASTHPWLTAVTGGRGTPWAWG